MLTPTNIFNLSAIFVGLISGFACLSVVSTYYVFPELRRLRYVEMVFYVAVCTCVAEIGMAIGVFGSSEGIGDMSGPTCTIQGLVTHAAFTCSVLWMTTITYQVYKVIFTRTIIQSMLVYHVVCWGLPPLLAVSVFITNTYKPPDDDTQKWCFIGSRSYAEAKNAGRIWEAVSFFCWLYGGTLTTLTLMALIIRRISVSQNAEETLRAALRRLICYPLILLFCWTPYIVLHFEQILHGEHHIHSIGLLRISTLAPQFQGLFVGLVFFAANPAVRRAWALKLCGDNSKHGKINSNQQSKPIFIDQRTSLTLLEAQAAGSNHHQQQQQQSMIGSLTDTSIFSLSEFVESEFDWIGPRSTNTAASAAGADTVADHHHHHHSNDTRNVRTSDLSDPMPHHMGITKGPLLEHLMDQEQARCTL